MSRVVSQNERNLNSMIIFVSGYRTQCINGGTEDVSQYGPPTGDDLPAQLVRELTKNGFDDNKCKVLIASKMLWSPDYGEFKTDSDKIVDSCQPHSREEARRLVSWLVTVIIRCRKYIEIGELNAQIERHSSDIEAYKGD